MLNIQSYMPWYALMKSVVSKTYLYPSHGRFLGFEPPPPHPTPPEIPVTTCSFLHVHTVSFPLKAFAYKSPLLHRILYYNSLSSVWIFLETAQWKLAKTKRQIWSVACSASFSFIFFLSSKHSAYSFRHTCNKWQEHSTHTHQGCSQSILPGGCGPCVST